MKTAFLIIPPTTEVVDRRKYITDCIDAVIKEGYVPFCPDLYEGFIKMRLSKFIRMMLPLSEAVFVFTDFSTGDILIRLVEKIDKEKPIYKKTLPGGTEKYQNTLESILKDISDKTKISIEKLLDKTRKREVCDARFVFYRRAKRCTKKSLARIGEFVGKDHATVLHGIREAENTKQVVELYDRCFPVWEQA
jgi:chromosomal replication initiation ATPase DnaA